MTGVVIDAQAIAARLRHFKAARGIVSVPTVKLTWFEIGVKYLGSRLVACEVRILDQVHPQPPCTLLLLLVLVSTGSLYLNLEQGISSTLL